ncbi:MAG: M67 family metallopeptidase [Acidimicrobiia bacterium]|nr:M67 family metallopeptidase [Acidimicrobiia bacterium]
MADEILQHSRAALPNEACGLLAADDSGIRRLYCVANADASPVSYTIDPAGHFAALQDAEENSWELVGAFHSHVNGPAYPSPTDVAGATEPDWTWLVVGPIAGSPEIRAYRIVAGEISEQELEIAGG